MSRDVEFPLKVLSDLAVSGAVPTSDRAKIVPHLSTSSCHKVYIPQSAPDTCLVILAQADVKSYALERAGVEIELTELPIVNCDAIWLELQKNLPLCL